jgi:large subunit ribosomal protein L4
MATARTGRGAKDEAKDEAKATKTAKTKTKAKAKTDALTIEVTDTAGKKVGEHPLDPAVFDVQVNVPAMHQVVVAGLAAARRGTHATKTRAEVSGGGRKPWRQKGTGRARHGSIRSPLWVGGGVAHGPHPRDYEQRVPKKMKRLALRSALTERARDGRIKVVDALSFDEPKTKAAVDVLGALETFGRILLVLSEPEELVEKSFRNLAGVKIVYPGNLSTYDVLYADWLLFTRPALEGVRGAAAPRGEAERKQAAASPRPKDAAEGSGLRRRNKGVRA